MDNDGSPSDNLNLDPSTWQGWFNSIILWAAKNPWNFIFNILLILSPLFIISLFLSWKLAKALENQKKEKKKKVKRDAKSVNKPRKKKGKMN